MCVKVEIWVNVEKFFKNIKWMKLCAKSYINMSQFFFFFLLTNKHNFSSNAREEKTEMGPVSRGEDFYPSAWIFAI